MPPGANPRHLNYNQQRGTMTSISKLMTASAFALCTAAFVSLSAPVAQAGEYCSTNTSGMRGCGFSSLEQCKAAMSGLMGTCARDPYYKDPTLALQAKHGRTRVKHTAAQ
jgi:uncharacterized protein DUF3551